MRKLILLIAFGLAVVPLVLVDGPASARPGSCDDLFIVEGTVVSIHEDRGMLLLTDDGDYVNVFGLGPPRYWIKSGVPVPQPGDFVFVEYYVTPLRDGSGDFCYVAESITSDDGTIQLRDDDCRPLWRKQP